MVGKDNGVAAKMKLVIPSMLACTDVNKNIEYVSTVERILTQP
jgi:hypothetical protein